VHKIVSVSVLSGEVRCLQEECDVCSIPEGEMRKDPIRRRCAREPPRERAGVEEQIMQAIRTASVGQIDELKVELNRGMVVLMGQTSWYRWKKAAQDAAMDLLGNVQLLNNIEVRQTLNCATRVKTLEIWPRER